MEDGGFSGSQRMSAGGANASWRSGLGRAWNILFFEIFCSDKGSTLEDVLVTGHCVATSLENNMSIPEFASIEIQTQADICNTQAALLSVSHKRVQNMHG
jgi:hypothetical protein